MRVLLNGLISLLPKSGIGHYIDNLYQHLAADDREITLFPSGIPRRLAREFLRFAPTQSGDRPLPANSMLSPRRWLRGMMRLGRQLGERVMRKQFRRLARQCQIYHEPNYIPFETDLPTVVTVHDLSVLLHPEWHPLERVRSFECGFRAGLEKSQHIITDSNAIRREMIERLDVPSEKVSTVHLGVRPIFQPMQPINSLSVLRSLRLEPGYLLHVGTIEPRKNLLMLMRAYVDLPRELRERHPLLLIGSWGWQARGIRDYYESTARQAGVRHIGYVADELLPAIYNAAHCLVFPSHYEGFGFPPLEMLACGGAVLASDTAAIAEMMPAGAELLLPNDPIAWREAMRWALRDEDYLNALRVGGPAHASRFTWAKCALETRAIYGKVLGEEVPADHQAPRRAAA
jgi:glycosyltransferase involved in cell wall biosynthesis